MRMYLNAFRGYIPIVEIGMRQVSVIWLLYPEGITFFYLSSKNIV